MKRDTKRKTETTLDVSAAAAALGRIRTPKKAAAVRKNLERANAVLTPEQRHERAKKAAAASAKVRHENAIRKRESAK